MGLVVQLRLGAALTGFNAARPPMHGQQVQVNASAEQQQPVQTKSMQTEMMQWRQQHPNALWKQVQDKFQTCMQQQPRITGVVNASRGSEWTASMLDTPEEVNISDCPYAGTFHPQLFGMIQEMNTGKMISGEDTARMISNLNQDSKRRRF